VEEAAPISRNSAGSRNLDQFRGGLAVLRDRGEVVGYVATVVEPMWPPFRPLRRQERVWLLVSWTDGSRERIFEDYLPWTSVAELREGHLSWDSPDGEVDLQASWLAGKDREQAWPRYGILDDISAYLAPPEAGDASDAGAELRVRRERRWWGWLPATWRARLESRRSRRFYGLCPSCGHDWREHDPETGCGECGYEADHGLPNAPTRRCRATAPGYTFSS
jgi:hypothetical protein